mgnify:CR=1 FL=1
MNAHELTLFTEEFVKEAFFGLGFVAIILLLNTALVLRIYLRFDTYCQRSGNPSHFKIHLWFMTSVLLICIVEPFSILLWTGVIYAKGLVTNLMLAMLFAGSCFTTVGIYSDILPVGWRFLALYISFSGLFSFAIATSALMAMIGRLAKKIEVKGN